MKIVSLESQDLDASTMTTDVCVVGAGAAGLYLAMRLGEAGYSVIVLEAGSQTAVSSVAAGFCVQFSGDVYGGAVEGRAFGVGGTTALWGGQLIPFAKTDAERTNSAHASAWARILRTTEEHRTAVGPVLGVAAGEFCGVRGQLPEADSASLKAAGFDPCISRWLPFSRRNFRWMARRGGRSGDGVRIVSEAVAADWQLQARAEGCRISWVEAISPSGKRTRVSADRFVVAAGAIESPRILMEINAASQGEMMPEAAALGRYLSDHLSFKVGEVAAGERSRAVAAFAPFFDHGLMRTWRFIKSRPDPAAPRYFAHFLFSTDNPGFNLARAVLRDAQAGRMPRVAPAEMWHGGAGLAQLAWSRVVRSRLFVPAGSPVGVQLDMEQRPDRSNMVKLGQDRDRYGRRIACLQWAIGDQDLRDMESSKQDFLAAWGQPGLGLPAIIAADGADASTKPHDAYHPVGTCRMGDDAEAVVDWDLKVRGATNLHVLSTAVLPSAGTANPTFTLLCLAEMLVGKLELRSGGNRIQSLR